jgi:hypothetical protein
MFHFLSIVTSIKDYIEITNKLIESDITKISSYNDYTAIFTFFILSLKDFFTGFHFGNLWSFSVVIPNIESAIISEISVFDTHFENTFNFLDTPTLDWTNPIDFEALFFDENHQLFSYSMQKLILGFINSFFLWLPTSVAHLIILRRFVLQGLQAGYLAGLGTIAGNILWISSILFGLRFIVIPWLTLDTIRYLLGFFILIKYLWDTHKTKYKIRRYRPNSAWKIFCINMLLAFTEQTNIYPFLKNFSITPESSLLETFPANSLAEYYCIHGCYILGLLIGCLLLLNFMCWIWEKPAYDLYMWAMTSFKIKVAVYYKVVYFTFLYLTLVLTFCSTAYYGVDYTLTNPIGYVHEDKLFAVGLRDDYRNPVLETSSLYTKPSDPDLRASRGFADPPDEEKFIETYQARDISLYDQGLYDLFPIEDLTFGFDRFWFERRSKELDRRIVRGIRLIGRFLYKFRRTLIGSPKERIKDYRTHFFILLEDYFYLPKFHDYKKKPFKQWAGFNSLLKKNQVERKENMSKKRIASHFSKIHLLRTLNPLIEGHFLDVPSILPNQKKTVGVIQNHSILDEVVELKKLTGEKDFDEKAAKGKVFQNHLEIVTKFSRKFSTRLSLTEQPKLVPELHKKLQFLLKKKKEEFLLTPQPKQFNQTTELFDSNVPFKNSVNRFNILNSPTTSTIQNTEKKRTNREKYLNFSQFQFLKESLKKKKKGWVNDLTPFQIWTETGKQDQKMSNFKKKDHNFFKMKNTTAFSDQNKNVGIIRTQLLHPIKYYFEKEKSFQRKLNLYGVNLYRKSSFENNSTLYRLMMKRIFYCYKPTRTWEDMMKKSYSERRFQKPQLYQGPKKITSKRKSRSPFNWVFAGNSKEKNKAKITNDSLNSKANFTKNPIINKKQENQPNPQNMETSRIQSYGKKFSSFSVIAKQASIYRTQIYRDLLEFWYYNPLKRHILKLDIDAFLSRQPKAHFLTKKEERLLHLRRFLLSEHYNTLRWYTLMQHYETMKSRIGGTKSMASRIYNQQFVGTFKKVRHLFAVTPGFSEHSVLKLDQPLFSLQHREISSNSNSIYSHEELATEDLYLLNSSYNQQKFELTMNSTGQSVSPSNTTQTTDSLSTKISTESISEKSLAERERYDSSKMNFLNHVLLKTNVTLPILTKEAKLQEKDVQNLRTIKKHMLDLRLHKSKQRRTLGLVLKQNRKKKEKQKKDKQRLLLARNSLVKLAVGEHNPGLFFLADETFTESLSPLKAPNQNMRKKWNWTIFKDFLFNRNMLSWKDFKVFFQTWFHTGKIIGFEKENTRMFLKKPIVQSKQKREKGKQNEISGFFNRILTKRKETLDLWEKEHKRIVTKKRLGVSKQRRPRRKKGPTRGQVFMNELNARISHLPPLEREQVKQQALFEEMKNVQARIYEREKEEKRKQRKEKHEMQENQALLTQEKIDQIELEILEDETRKQAIKQEQQEEFMNSPEMLAYLNSERFRVRPELLEIEKEDEEEIERTRISIKTAREQELYNIKERRRARKFFLSDEDDEQRIRQLQEEEAKDHAREQIIQKEQQEEFKNSPEMLAFLQDLSAKKKDDKIVKQQIAIGAARWQEIQEIRARRIMRESLKKQDEVQQKRREEKKKEMEEKKKEMEEKKREMEEEEARDQAREKEIEKEQQEKFVNTREMLALTEHDEYRIRHDRFVKATDRKLSSIKADREQELQEISKRRSTREFDLRNQSRIRRKVQETRLTEKRRDSEREKAIIYERNTNYMNTREMFSFLDSERASRGLTAVPPDEIERKRLSIKAAREQELQEIKERTRLRENTTIEDAVNQRIREMEEERIRDETRRQVIEEEQRLDFSESPEMRSFLDEHQGLRELKELRRVHALAIEKLRKQELQEISERRRNREKIRAEDDVEDEAEQMRREERKRELAEEEARDQAREEVIEQEKQAEFMNSPEMIAFLEMTNFQEIPELQQEAIRSQQSYIRELREQELKEISNRSDIRKNVIKHALQTIEQIIKRRRVEALRKRMVNLKTLKMWKFQEEKAILETRKDNERINEIIEELQTEFSTSPEMLKTIHSELLHGLPSTLVPQVLLTVQKMAEKTRIAEGKKRIFIKKRREVQEANMKQTKGKILKRKEKWKTIEKRKRAIKKERIARMKRREIKNTMKKRKALKEQEEVIESKEFELMVLSLLREMHDPREKQKRLRTEKEKKKKWQRSVKERRKNERRKREELRKLTNSLNANDVISHDLLRVLKKITDRYVLRYDPEQRSDILLQTAKRQKKIDKLLEKVRILDLETKKIIDFFKTELHDPISLQLLDWLDSQEASKSLNKQQLVKITTEILALPSLKPEVKKFIEKFKKDWFLFKKIYLNKTLEKKILGLIKLKEKDLPKDADPYLFQLREVVKLRQLPYFNLVAQSIMLRRDNITEQEFETFSSLLYDSMYGRRVKFTQELIDQEKTKEFIRNFSKMEINEEVVKDLKYQLESFRRNPEEMDNLLLELNTESSEAIALKKKFSDVIKQARDKYEIGFKPIDGEDAPIENDFNDNWVDFLEEPSLDPAGDDLRWLFYEEAYDQFVLDENENSIREGESLDALVQNSFQEAQKKVFEVLHNGKELKPSVSIKQSHLYQPHQLYNWTEISKRLRSRKLVSDLKGLRKSKRLKKSKIFPFQTIRKELFNSSLVNKSHFLMDQETKKQKRVGVILPTTPKSSLKIYGPNRPTSITPTILTNQPKKQKSQLRKTKIVTYPPSIGNNIQIPLEVDNEKAVSIIKNHPRKRLNPDSLYLLRKKRDQFDERYVIKKKKSKTKKIHSTHSKKRRKKNRKRRALVGSRVAKRPKIRKTLQEKDFNEKSATFPTRKIDLDDFKTYKRLISTIQKRKTSEATTGIITKSTISISRFDSLKSVINRLQKKMQTGKEQLLELKTRLMDSKFTQYIQIKPINADDLGLPKPKIKRDYARKQWKKRTAKARRKRILRKRSTLNIVPKSFLFKKMKKRNQRVSQKNSFLKNQKFEVRLEKKASRDIFEIKESMSLEKETPSIIDENLLERQINLLTANRKEITLPQTIPFYAGWDESLRQFIITNRLLSREEQIDNDFVKGMNMKNVKYTLTPFALYNIDVYYNYGAPGYTPLHWRRIEFRHHLLNTWRNLQTKLYPNKIECEKSERSVVNDKNQPKLIGTCESYEQETESSKLCEFPEANQTKRTDKNSAIFENEKRKIEEKKMNCGEKSLNRKIFLKSKQEIKHIVPSTSAQNANKILASTRIADGVYPTVKKRNKNLQNHSPRLYGKIGPSINEVLPIYYLLTFDMKSRSTPGILSYRYVEFKKQMRKFQKLGKKQKRAMRLDIPKKTKGEVVLPELTFRRRITNLSVSRAFHFPPLLEPRQTLELERWRPFQKKRLPAEKSRSDLIKEEELIDPKFDRTLDKRLYFQPNAGGFVWAGDYLRLIQSQVPRVKNTPQYVKRKQNQNKKGKRRVRKVREMINWIEPVTKRNLIEQHNKRVIKKKLKKAQRTLSK